MEEVPNLPVIDESYRCNDIHRFEVRVHVAMLSSYFGSERNSSNTSISFIMVYDNKQITYIGALFFASLPQKRVGKQMFALNFILHCNYHLPSIRV